MLLLGYTDLQASEKRETDIMSLITHIIFTGLIEENAELEVLRFIEYSVVHCNMRQLCLYLSMQKTTSDRLCDMLSIYKKYGKNTKILH